MMVAERRRLCRTCRRLCRILLKSRVVTLRPLIAEVGNARRAESETHASTREWRQLVACPLQWQTYSMLLTCIGQPRDYNGKTSSVDLHVLF